MSEPQRTVYITETGRAPGTDMANNNVPPPPVADNTYYPPSDLPANRVSTIFGTVTRNLPGERSFEIQSDNGTVCGCALTWMSRRASVGATVSKCAGNMRAMCSLPIRCVSPATPHQPRRTRLTGIVESVRSATRLTMRGDNGQIITVVTTTPFPATITEGDSIRAVGSLNGTFMNAERVVLLTDRRGETEVGQPVDFRATVEAWMPSGARFRCAAITACPTSSVLPARAALRRATWFALSAPPSTASRQRPISRFSDRARTAPLSCQ